MKGELAMKLFRRTFILINMTFILLLIACAKKDISIDPGEKIEVDSTEGNEDKGEAEVISNIKDDTDIIDDGRLTLAKLSAKPLTELTAIEMARIMGNGINLTNTMEACAGSANRIPNREPSVYEKIWGQPITTQEIIDGMRASGFKSLRVPVAWLNAMDFESGDLTIGEAYLDRIEEIINYALKADMFVMINDHWDNGWWSMFGHPEQEVRDLAMQIYVSMWTQIAERYKNYDSRLIFESSNEELGDGLNAENAFSPTGGILTKDERFETTNKINQTFVDVVRKTGGNNSKRFLLVNGYNTDFDNTLDDKFVMPVDTVADKLLIGVHYYNPWSYCGDTAGVSAWGTMAEVENMHELLGRMKKFTDQGYGVVIGEWGVLDNVGEDRYDYYLNFLNLNAKYGYVPFLWDGGNIYSRKDYTIRAHNDEDDYIDKVKELYKSFDVSERANMTIEEIVELSEEHLTQAMRKAEKKAQLTYGDDEAYAWIMFTSSDWGTQYSVGDKYEPSSKAAGLVATDVEIIGPGTYTIGIDMSQTAGGYANGMLFSAVGIVNAEKLYPGCIIDITEVIINGESAELSGVPYTTSDDGNTTRVNLYNNWVTGISDDARTPDEDLSNATPIPLDKYIETQIKTIDVTFNLIEG